MYSKVYHLGCDSAHSEDLLKHYDEHTTPAIKSSEYHVGHLMIENGVGKWILVSHYHDKAAAQAAQSMVQELVKPLVENFNMTLEIIAEGEMVRSY